MLRLLTLWLCLLPLNALADPSESKADGPVLRVALTRNAFRDASINDATAAYRVFVNTITKNRESEVRVETEIFEDRASFSSAINRSENPPQLIVVMAWDYLQMDLPSSVHPRFVVVEDDQPGRRFVLLSNRKSGATTIADLKGKSLIWRKYSETSFIPNWIETLLSEADMPPSQEFFSTISPSSKATSVVLPVFFGTQDSCVIDEPSFLLMGELNPQVLANLTVIARSEVLADVVVCFRDDAWESETLKQLVMEGIADLDSSVDGAQVLTLFQIRSLQPFEPRHLDSSRRLMQRWQNARSGDAP